MWWVTCFILAILITLVFIVGDAHEGIQVRAQQLVGGDCTVSADELPLDEEESAAWEAINSYRVEHQLPALVLSANLVESSQWMARNMATLNYTEHRSLDGRNPGQRMFACGYPAWTGVPNNPGGNGMAGWGENIAWGYQVGAPAEVVNGWDPGVFEGWRQSPGHNAVMLHSAMRAGGIARAYDADSNWRWYWVFNVGTLLESPPVLVLTPTATPTLPVLTQTPTATLQPTRTLTLTPTTTSQVNATPTTTALPTSTPARRGRYAPTRVPVPPWGW